MSDLDDFAALMQRFGIEMRQYSAQVARRPRRSGTDSPVRWTTVALADREVGVVRFAFDETGKFNEMLVDW